MSWKGWVRLAVALVLTLDVVLFIYAARNQSQKAQAESLERLRIQHHLLAADVTRAREIRERLPEVRKQCDEFYAKQLRPVSGGYAQVVADLDAIAQGAGLRTTAVSFKQRAIPERGVVSIEVTASVEGDYASLVRFINGIDRSDSFYLLNDLALVSSSSGGIKLNLALRTYFRS